MNAAGTGNGPNGDHQMPTPEKNAEMAMAVGGGEGSGALERVRAGDRRGIWVAVGAGSPKFEQTIYV